MQSPLTLRFEQEVEHYERCFSRLAHARSTFMSRANVCGVGVGPKQVAGRMSPDRPCLIVYVTEKQRTSDLDQQDRIPQVFRGVPTDVVELGSRVVPVHNEFDQRWLATASNALSQTA